jgi:hypothetical protein
LKLEPQNICIMPLIFKIIVIIVGRTSQNVTDMSMSKSPQACDVRKAWNVVL